MVVRNPKSVGGGKVRKIIYLFLPYLLIIVTSNSKTVLKIYVFWSLCITGARDGLLWHLKSVCSFYLLQNTW